jgi:hypothetical protein
MISYAVYRVVHLVGIFLLLVALGGLSLGSARAEAGGPGGRRLAMALHGVALFIVLLGGFGLLARLGIMHGMGWPGWVWMKLGIWILMGAAVVIPRRRPAWGPALLMLIPALGGVAAWIAIFKPF